MNLSDIVTRVADDSNTNTTITTVNNRLIRSVNRICSELWNGFRWSFRYRNYRIATDVDYTAGTLTATNGSRTVTGSGTVFLSTHKDWHLVFNNDATQNWYKIRAFTSSTQLELDVPYQGATGAAKTYTLRHFDYVLPTEPWDLGSITVTADRRTMAILEPTSLDVVAPVPFYNGYPTACAFIGSDSMPTIYSTGTVSGTINTTTLTGVGTSWLANIYPADQVVIGSYTYSVRSVDTDTQITLYNQQQLTSTTATYTITRQFGRLLRIMWPSTTAYTVDIRALRKYVALVNNNDTNELFDRCPNAVILKASALELKSQNDKRWQLLDRDAEAAMMRAKAEDDSLTPRDQVSPVFSYRNTTGRTRDRWMS